LALIMDYITPENNLNAPDYDPSEFASLQLLEQGDVDVWVRRRGVILLEKSRETAKECEAGKLASAITVGASIVMSSNPLAWVPMVVGAAGYIHTIFQEFQDTGSIRLIPMYRGKLGDILKVMEGGQATQRHPLEDQIEYLSEAEKDEVLLINYRFGEIAGVLNSAPPKVRFDLYRHLCGQFHARRDLLTGEEVAHYINTATSEARRVIPPQPQPTIEQGEPRAIAERCCEAQIAPKPVEYQDAEAIPSPLEQSVQPEQPKDSDTSKPTSEPAPHVSLTSGQVGLEILQALATSRRSTLLIGDTGAGKSVTQAYILNKLFELHPDAQVFGISQKADSFCGLAEQGRVTLFDPTEPEQALFLIHSIWLIYDQRRRLPESDRPGLPPVRLILADWLSINQALEELKNEETVKLSRYLTKLADIVYNGRELNVCLLVDLQSYNLAAVGLKADRNSRKNFNLIGLGNYSVDELGMVNESYGVLTNLIGDRYIIAEESERVALNTTFKQLQPISKQHRRPILFSSLSPARLALLPDLRSFKGSKVAATKQPVTTPQPTDLPTQPEEATRPIEPTTELKVSDSLAEPLKTIWLMAKERADWVTVRDIQRKDFAILKGKGSKQIRQCLGLLADTGYGEIDEEDKSDSSVRFKAY
jgi:hypothetical protein